MAIIQFIFLLVLILVIMVFLFPKILYIVTALYYFIQGSDKQKRKKRGAEFSLKDFREMKEKKIVFK